jgi:putative membrane protein
MKRIGQLGIACIAALTLACDTQTSREDNSTIGGNDNSIGTSGVSAGDTEFVEDAASSGMTEVRLGELAQQKAQNPEVKQFAEMMVRDHTKGGEALKQIAQQHSITVPSQPNDEHADLINRLSQESGAEFDREYMDAMVESHEDMIDLLQTRASEDRFGDNKGTVRPESSDNPVEAALNQYASNTLPTARQHLEEARRVRDALGNRSTPRGTTGTNPNTGRPEPRTTKPQGRE